jgi:hypothetical protein
MPRLLATDTMRRAEEHALALAKTLFLPSEQAVRAAKATKARYARIQAEAPSLEIAEAMIAEARRKQPRGFYRGGPR